MLCSVAKSRLLAGTALTRSRVLTRRWLTDNSATESAAAVTKKKTGWWHSAELWGGLGALAGWGMSASAIYDAANKGPEVISLTMTPVLIVYSSMFTYWSFIIIPKNMLLAGCHITNVIAQSNQLRRVLEHKLETGKQDEVTKFGQQAALGASVIAGSILLGPIAQRAVVNADLGVVSTIAGADAGPFTVHFWGPMSKWLISGASFMDLHRPTDQISIAQYTALTLTGFFFTRYSFLVTPVNYMLASVNVALFTSSAWHLGRKIKADYL
jgi:hypothetical protein